MIITIVLRGKMFINRVNELEILEEKYASGQAEMYVLYGRRRVGKTELLNHFSQGKRHIFYVADLDAEPTLRASFSASVNQALFGPDAASGVYPTWEAIFRLLGNQAQNERLVVTLDEFTYLATAHPPLLTTLQRLWDQELRHSKLMLILCGSYIGMMEDAVLGYNAPLYGRRTGQYLLEPVVFRDARLFLPHLNVADQVRSYALFGGTPAYLMPISNTRSVLNTVRDQVLTRGTFFYDEARFLLQQELREPRNYFAILEAIASGRTRLNEIKQATGLDGATAYLSTLQDLQLIERVVPITETQPHKSRRGLYRLRDHFFRFWFRFVHPNRTLLEQGASQIVLDTYIKPQLDAFVGPVFEIICQQFLWQLGLSGKLPFVPHRIGGWWQGGEEIDLIAVGQDSALVVECKWTSRAVGTNILRDLERKAKLVKNRLNINALLFGLCSRSGFTDQLEQDVASRNDVLLFNLSQIAGDTD